MKKAIKDLENKNGRIRGKSIKTISDFLDTQLSQGKYEEISEFLEELPRELENPEKVYSIFNKYYDAITEISTSHPSMSARLALSIERILDRQDNQLRDQDKLLRLGSICEYLAAHTNDITGFMYLKKAAVAYARASKPEEAERINKAKQEKIIQFTKVGLQSAEIPERIRNDFYLEAEEVKQTLQKLEYEELLNTIALTDPFQILVSKNDLISDGRNALSIFEQMPGIMTAAQVTTDGRILNQNSSDVTLRALQRGLELWQIIAQINIVCFGELLTEFLSPNAPDYSKRLGHLAKLLSFSSDDSSEEARFGLQMVLNLHADNNLECLSIGLPFIERTIRNMALKFGYNPVRLETDIRRPEVFKVLNYLKNDKVKAGMSEKLCESLEIFLLMDENGFGLNLRNNVAHGVMRFNEYGFFYSYLIIYLLIQIAGRELINRNDNKETG